MAEYQSYRDAFERNMIALAEKQLLKLAYRYERILQMSFRAPKSGAPGRPGRTRSAPGEPPAIDTGRLSQSVKHDLRRTGGEYPVLSVVIGTDVEYAKYLEYGTSNMEARPAWFPALRQLQREFSDVIGGIAG